MINVLQPVDFRELVHEIANSNAAVYQYNAISHAASVNLPFRSMMCSLQFHEIVGYDQKFESIFVFPVHPILLMDVRTIPLVQSCP